MKPGSPKCYLGLLFTYLSGKMLIFAITQLRTQMKRFIAKAFLLLLPLCLAVSCELMEEFQTPTVFEVSLTSDSINASQTEVTAKVICDIKWTAKLSDSSWGSIVETATSGGDTGIVVIDLGFNSGKEARSNVLTVTAGTKTMSLNITQEGLDALVQPAKLQLRGQEPVTVEFKPGVNWTLASGTEWIKLPERTSGLAGVEVSLSIKAGEDFVDVGTREGSVTFTFDGKYPVEVPVTQYQTDAIILETTSLEIDSKAQTVTVKVDYNTDYTVSTASSWVHIVDTKALNVDEFSFTVDANPTSKDRTASVVFAGGENGKVSATLSVLQEGRDAILDNTGCGLYGVGGTDFLLVPNTMQVTRTLNGDGTYTCRLIVFRDLTVCTLTGLPVVQEDDSKCTLNLSVTRAGASLLNKNAECILVGQSDELRWYRIVGGSEYFIIPGSIQ